MARTEIGRGRQAAYHGGLVLVLAGIAVVGLSFLSAFSIVGKAGGLVGDLAGSAGQGRPPPAGAVEGFVGQVFDAVFRTVLQTFGGVGLIVGGALLRRVGARGLAGAGVVLDPRRARQDVRPWSEMQGGVLRDTLDAAGLTPPAGAAPPPPPGSPTPGPGADLPFDERLRRLHRLRQEGLLSEAEYQRERKEVLDGD
jgi:hypothetical protein